jgi:hypothetical protein
VFKKIVEKQKSPEKSGLFFKIKYYFEILGTKTISVVSA